MSRAWMPLYVADYLADTGHLTTAEHGAYLLLIMHYWSNGGLPDDERKLARIARMTPEEWAEARDTIAEFFQDGWRHKRIDKEQIDAQAAYDRRAAAGRRGGHAKAEASSNARAMPEQCYSENVAMLKQSQSQSQSHIVISPTDLSADAAADLPPPKFSRKPNPEKTTLLTAVGERWNDLASSYGLPAIQTIDGGRERACLARAKDLTHTYEYPNAEIGFDELFEKIRSSAFLRGDAKPRNGGGAFRATFDWVMAQSNFRKIMENTYG